MFIRDEWEVDCGYTPSEHLFAISWREQVIFLWDKDDDDEDDGTDIRFILDKHA